MAFTGFYKTDLLGVPQNPDYSLLNHAALQNAQIGAEERMQRARLANEKEGRAAQLKKQQEDRADKMAKTSTFFPENQKEVSGLVQSSNEDIRKGYDISDKVNYAHHVASMDAIHKNDFDQNEVALRDYHEKGIPQATAMFEADHAGNKLKIHHTNANEVNSQERADVQNGKYYQAEVHPEQYHKSLEKSPFEDSVTKETPTTKSVTDISGSTAFPVDEQAALPDGTKTVKRRAARTVEEMTKKDASGNSYASRFLNTSPMVANHWKEAAVRARQAQIAQNTDSRMKAATDAGLVQPDANGNLPEQLRKSAYEQSVNEEAEKMAAERLLHTDMGGRKIKVTNENKAPKAAPKMNHDERENTYDVHNMGTDAKTYNTLANTSEGLKNGRFKSHGGVVIKNKNNKKPTLTLNEQTVKNESTGKYEPLVEGSEATLDNIRFGYYEKGKEGTKKLHIPDSSVGILEYVEKLTPQQVVDRDIKLEPTAYLTVHKAGGTGDTGLSPYETARYAMLKQKFAKKIPKEGTADYREYDEMRQLGAVKDQKEKTYSVAYKNVEGQLAQLIGDKNARPESLASKLDRSDHDAYLKAERILERKRKEYKQTPQEGPHGARVSQGGKTYVWNGKDYVEQN